MTIETLMKMRALFPGMTLLAALLFFSSNNQPPHGNKEAGETAAETVTGADDGAAGMLHPCDWTFTVEQTGPGEAILVSTAKIDPGWHLYSQHISEKGSPTVFTYEPSPAYQLAGVTEEGPSQKDYDPY